MYIPYMLYCAIHRNASIILFPCKIPTHPSIVQCSLYSTVHVCTLCSAFFFFFARISLVCWVGSLSNQTSRGWCGSDLAQGQGHGAEGGEPNRKRSSLFVFCFVLGRVVSRSGSVRRAQWKKKNQIIENDNYLANVAQQKRNTKDVKKKIRNQAQERRRGKERSKETQRERKKERENNSRLRIPVLALMYASMQAQVEWAPPTNRVDDPLSAAAWSTCTCNVHTMPSAYSSRVKVWFQKVAIVCCPSPVLDVSCTVYVSTYIHTWVYIGLSLRKEKEGAKDV